MLTLLYLLPSSWLLLVRADAVLCGPVLCVKVWNADHVAEIYM